MNLLKSSLDFLQTFYLFIISGFRLIFAVLFVPFYSISSSHRSLSSSLAWRIVFEKHSLILSQITLKQFLKPWIFSFIICVFVSCDCYTLIEGKVIDAETQLPIDSVMIRAYKRPIIKYTDNLGKFGIGPFLSPVSPRMKLLIEKKGYKKVKKIYGTHSFADNLVIKLEKLDKD